MSAVYSPYFTRLRSKKPSSIDVTGISAQVKKSTKEIVPRKKEKEEKKINVSKFKTESQEVTAEETIKENIEVNQRVKRQKPSKWEPTKWEEQLANIRKMRKSLDAPVDTMGCEKCKGEDYSEKVISSYLLK